MTSRYDLTRRIVAPLALAAAIGLLLHQSCGAEERAAVDFTVDLGDRRDLVERVRVELWDGDAPIGSFEAAPSRPLTWRQPVGQEELVARIAITRKDGTVETFERRIHAPAGARVTIPAGR